MTMGVCGVVFAEAVPFFDQFRSPNKPQFTYPPAAAMWCDAEARLRGYPSGRRAVVDHVESVMLRYREARP